jgi:DNA-directed RNA polymerase subunit N (RpoN/RPB10)
MFAGRLVLGLLMFILCVSELSYGGGEGSEEVQFKLNIQDFKAKLKKNEDDRKGKIEKLEKELSAPGKTGKEISVICEKLAKAYAEIVVNTGIAEDKIAEARRLLKGADTWYNPKDPNSANKFKSLAERSKGYATDIRGLLERLEEQVSRMAVETTTTPSDASRINKAFAKNFNLRGKQFQKILSVLESAETGDIPDIENSTQTRSYFSNMEAVLEIYANAVKASKVLDELEVKKYCAMGNITHVQGKISELIKEVTGDENGKVEDYFDNMWQDSYEKELLDDIMMRKILDGTRDNSLFHHEVFRKLTKRADEFIDIPDEVFDGNPDHKYYLDTKRKEWFWYDHDMEVKHYDVPRDPYLTDDDWRYVRYDESKGIWLSIHPDYDGDARPIVIDTGEVGE